jgi:hypothetical protein
MNDSKASCNCVCRATITACKSIKGESTCDLLGKNSKLRLVAINQQYYSNGRKTRNRKVHMTATLRQRAEQNIGGGGALTSIFRQRRLFGSDGKFPEIFISSNFADNVRRLFAHRFLLAYFLAYYLFRDIFTLLSMAFIVLSMLRESFWKLFEHFRKFSGNFSDIFITTRPNTINLGNRKFCICSLNSPKYRSLIADEPLSF